jgi:integrase
MKLRHIQTVTKKNGKVYRYLRIPGRNRVVLPDLPVHHPKFLTAYAEAMSDQKEQPRAAKGTIGALIEAYIDSPQHKALSPDYRRVIRRELDEIKVKGGKGQASDLEARHIRKDPSELSPHKSVARRKEWRCVCKFGCARSLLATDPSEGVKGLRPGATVGHPAWKDEELAAFRARWGLDTIQRRGFELLYWTGARISDAVFIGEGTVGKDGVLEFLQSKTGEKAFVPWTCALPTFAILCAGDRELMFKALEHAPKQGPFLATKRGTVRSAQAFGNMISKAAREAGFKKSAHGLRKTRSVRLAEGGATPHQIAAWTGHKSLSEVTHYTEELDRRRVVTGKA